MPEPLNFERIPPRGSMKWTTYPADVLPAWVADMDFEIAPAIRATLSDLIARSDAGYPLPYAKAGLADIFCARMQQRWDWHIAPSQVEFFSDVVQIIYLALLTLTERGDGVVIQTPIYPPFLQAVADTERRACICPLVQGAGGYGIDFDALEANIEATTRVLLLCHPHNPTGRAFTREELMGLGALVLKHNLLVISDEIHADLMLDERPHIPFASLSSELAARTITLTSPSKPFNIAGLCLAVAVFGSPELKARFHTVPAHVRGGRSALGIAAARAAWTESDDWLTATLVKLRENRARVATFFQAIGQQSSIRRRKRLISRGWIAARSASITSRRNSFWSTPRLRSATAPRLATRVAVSCGSTSPPRPRCSMRFWPACIARCKDLDLSSTVKPLLTGRCWMIGALDLTRKK